MKTMRNALASLLLLLGSMQCHAQAVVDQYAWFQTSGFFPGFLTSEPSCGEALAEIDRILQAQLVYTDSIENRGLSPATRLAYQCTDPDPEFIWVQYQRADGFVLTGGWGIVSCGGLSFYSTNPGSSEPWIEIIAGKCICSPPSTFYKASTQQCTAVNPANDPSDPKNNSCQSDPDCSVVDPINPAVGNNWRVETDFAAKQPGNALAFTRTYNSNVFSTNVGTVNSFGANWVQTYDSKGRQIANPQTNTSAPACYTWGDDNTFAFCAPAQSNLTATPSGISMLRPDGKSLAFGQVGSNWVSSNDVNDKVQVNLAGDGVTVTGWTFTTADGSQTEQYDPNGKLLSVTSSSGVMQTLTYSNGLNNDSSVGRVPANAPVCPHVQSGSNLPAGLLLCVTDSWGHQIQFEYDNLSRVSKMIDPNGQGYLYAYDGPSGGCTNGSTSNPACSANNLTQLTFPDGSVRTYWYNEATQINGGVSCVATSGMSSQFGHLLNALTSIVDENGVRYTSWTYDCTGRATSNQLAGNANQTSIAYGTPNANGVASATLTDTLGNPASPVTNVHTFGFQYINGVAKIASISQPCAECKKNTTYTYDANTNVSSATDFNGNVTTYQYDLTRNLQTSRTEAYGTPQARNITTQWHPTYALPTLITESGRTTAYNYDPSGNLLSKTVTAGGGSRTWSYTYNSLGQRTSVTGPRTDVSDLTRYTYDAGGNLSSVINAMGQTTTYGNYDANGNLGLITAPNGSTTAFTYSPRGWLTSKVVTTGEVVQSTSYVYDSVGQLILVTLPDNSTVSYTYDAAHRLTGIRDSVGDTISYTLDLRGNRMGEAVTDPNGNLTQQVSRIYDTVNRLQQVTGATQ